MTTNRSIDQTFPSRLGCFQRRTRILRFQSIGHRFEAFVQAMPGHVHTISRESLRVAIVSEWERQRPIGTGGMSSLSESLLVQRERIAFTRNLTRWLIPTAVKCMNVVKHLLVDLKLWNTRRNMQVGYSPSTDRHAHCAALWRIGSLRLRLWSLWEEISGHSQYETASPRTHGHGRERLRLSIVSLSGVYHHPCQTPYGS